MIAPIRKNLKTTIHYYSFDTNDASDKKEWLALKTKLKAQGLKVFESHGGGSHYHAVKEQSYKILLDSKCIFSNQWNTEAYAGSDYGRRVFDWAMDYQMHCKTVKKGHYIEQTKEMHALRKDIHQCGYCGHYEPANQQRDFCPACIGSEYLTADTLHLTRLQSVVEEKRQELTEKERAKLIPLFKQAQIYGNTERDKKRIAERREEIVKERKAAIANANNKADGLLWLMDNNINTKT